LLCYLKASSIHGQAFNFRKELTVHCLLRYSTFLLDIWPVKIKPVSYQICKPLSLSITFWCHQLYITWDLINTYCNGVYAQESSYASFLWSTSWMPSDNFLLYEERFITVTAFDLMECITLRLDSTNEVEQWYVRRNCFYCLIT
jgi:hypothetical protein